MARMRRELCFSAGSFTYAGLYQMWGRVPVQRPFRFFEECRYEYRHGRRGACATGNFQHARLGQVPVERPDPEGDPEGTPVATSASVPTFFDACRYEYRHGRRGACLAFVAGFGVVGDAVGSMAAPVANLPSGGATEVST